MTLQKYEESYLKKKLKWFKARGRRKESKPNAAGRQKEQGACTDEHCHTGVKVKRTRKHHGGVPEKRHK